MQDVRESLKRALVEQGWIFGDRVARLGSPFEWSENQHKANILDLENMYAVAFYFSMFYVQKETPKEMLVPEYEEVNQYCREKIVEAFNHFFPFLADSETWAHHVQSQALIRTQDYSFIKRHCTGLPGHPNHIDVGPGLGSSALYSLRFLKSTFYALEASPMSYGVQRHFFRFLSPQPGSYFDLIECENFQLPVERIKAELDNNRYAIKHVPSWRFPLLKAGSMDLLTACYVLNELNHAGMLWLLAEGSRVLRKGGYFYIRDSSILKPGMHTVDYDETLKKMGFIEVARLKLQNRHDFFGVPRVFMKNTEATYSFDDLVEMCLGRFASVAGGGDRAYNLDTDGNTKQD